MNISNTENYVLFFNTENTESYLLGIHYIHGNIGIVLHMFSDNEEIYPFQTYSAYVFDVNPERVEEIVENTTEFILDSWDLNCTHSEIIEHFHELVPIVERYCH